MKVAVEGCAHGDLDNIYESIKTLEQNEKIKIDLLICCGDFQSVRNEQDLRCMAVPPKYYNICSFYKYYSGEKEVPLLTIFIGGNHEASNYLQELPFGGWVAPKIYYLGYAGVINIGGIRIGGISGIYKGRDYLKGHYEMTPYSEDSKRSVYHIRNVDVYRLKQLSKPIDVFLSHDWPTDITKHGNEEQLLRFKPFFRDDVESGKLGSPPCNDLLRMLKPNYWFSAHLHCKFAAMVRHDDNTSTKFLALDKCLPNRRFMQIIDMPTAENADLDISYDLEWLTILFLTNHLFSVKNVTQYVPGPGGRERYDFTPTEEETRAILEKFNNNLKIPINFIKTAASYVKPNTPSKAKIFQPPPKINPQTTQFCKRIGIDDPSEKLIKLNGSLDLSQLSNFNHSFTDETEGFNDLDTSATLLDSTVSPTKRTSLHLPTPINDNNEQPTDYSIKPNEVPSDDTEITDVSNLSPTSADTSTTNCSVLTINSTATSTSLLDASHITIDSTDSLCISSDVNAIDTPNTSTNEIGEAENSDTVAIGSDTPPSIKKFKRRNADIYAENEVS